MTSSAWSVTAAAPACPACVVPLAGWRGDGEAPVPESALPDGPRGQGPVVLTRPQDGAGPRAGGGGRDERSGPGQDGKWPGRARSI